MDESSLKHAKNEAERFLQTVRDLEVRRKAEAVNEQEAKLAGHKYGGGYLYAFQGCRESAAVRRASLDLTRALADLRR